MSEISGEIKTTTDDRQSLSGDNNNNNNNIYSGSSTHRSVFPGGPVIYIYIIHGKLYYAYLKTIKYLQMDYI